MTSLDTSSELLSWDTQTRPVPRSKYFPRPCPRCGAKELRRKPRTLRHNLTAIHPWFCARCGHHKNEFHLTLGVIAGVLLLLTAAGAAAWLLTTSFPFRPAETGVVSALSVARASAGNLSAFEQMMLHKPKETLDNASVVKLCRENVATEVILHLIRTSNANYDVSANSIIELKRASVDKAVILAMIDAAYSTR